MRSLICYADGVLVGVADGPPSWEGLIIRFTVRVFRGLLKRYVEFFPFAFEAGILEFLIIAFLFTLLNLETAAERYIT